MEDAQVLEKTATKSVRRFGLKSPSYSVELFGRVAAVRVHGEGELG
jgi:hypothetical protein